MPFPRYLFNKKAQLLPLRPTILGSGGRTRTCDLRVMSPTSCHCSTPRYCESICMIRYKNLMSRIYRNGLSSKMKIFHLSTFETPSRLFDMFSNSLTACSSPRRGVEAIITISSPGLIRPLFCLSILSI